MNLGAFPSEEYPCYVCNLYQECNVYITTSIRLFDSVFICMNFANRAHSCIAK